MEVLYILMRNDLDSMNSGKAIAQGSHASNAFIDHFLTYASETAEPDIDIINAGNVWQLQTKQGFGTVLVLEADMKEIQKTVDIAQKMGYISGIVHDPTYPIVDGKVVHYLPLDTCAYVFVPDKSNDDMASFILGKYPLHR